MKRFLFSLLASAALLAVAGCAGVTCGKQQETCKSASNKRVVFPVNADKTFSVSGFRTIDSKWCTEQTEVFLQRSKDGITFTFHCFGDTSKMRFSPKTKDDNMNLFGGEHVELLLSPNGHADGIYYHIAINPAGSMYHAKKRDTSWTPAHDLMIDIKKDRWIAKLFLPYYTLGVKTPPANGKVWLANFCRTSAQKNKITEHSSYTASKNFHDLNSMTKVIFGSNAPKASLQIRSVHQQPDGTLKIHTGKYGRTPVEIQVLLNGKCLRSYPLTAPDHFEHVFTIWDNDPYIPLKNNRLLTLRMNDLQGNTIDEKSGYLYSVDQNFLLLDQYVYFKNNPIRFDVLVTPGTFRIKKEDKVIAQKTVNALNDSFKQPLAPGRYVAEYEAKGRYTTSVFFVQDKRPAVQKALANKFKIAGSNLTLNGKPVYLFTTSEGKLKNYQYYPDYTFRYGPGARKNAIRRGGLPLYHFIRKPKTGYVFVKDLDARLDKFIQTQKKHQWSNIIYVLAYEASMATFLRQPDNSMLEVDSPTFYKKVYTRMKQGMPDAKIGIHIDNLNRIDEFIDCCDIFEFACWSSSYHGSNLMLNLKKDLLNIRSKAKGKPVVMWLGGSIPNPQCRSAEELRAGVYSCILNGAAGNVIHMGHGGVPASRTRFWSALNAITREVESFYADLNTWKEVKFDVPANMEGKAVISPDGKELLLVLLNNTMGKAEVSLDLPGSFGKLNKTFTPLEPRVFRIKKTK